MMSGMNVFRVEKKKNDSRVTHCAVARILLACTTFSCVRDYPYSWLESDSEIIGFKPAVPTVPVVQIAGQISGLDLKSSLSLQR